MHTSIVYIYKLFFAMCTLVDNEAVFRQVSSGNATPISSQQKEDFGGGFPDSFNTSLVAQVQCCYLAGHSIHIENMTLKIQMLFKNK